MKKYVFFLAIVASALFFSQGFTSLPNSINGVKQNDSFDINRFKGKIVVLNFWASWSKNSRNENKTLLHVYQTYKMNPKVVFVSVSLDIEDAAWKAAIEEDELVWKDQFCDFKKYNSPMALKYGVNTLPKFFIFNGQGKQVYTANTSHELETNVSNLLK